MVFLCVHVCCFLVTIHFFAPPPPTPFLRWGHSLAFNLGSRLGWLAGESQAKPVSTSPEPGSSTHTTVTRLPFFFPPSLVGSGDHMQALVPERQALYQPHHLPSLYGIFFLLLGSSAFYGQVTHFSVCGQPNRVILFSGLWSKAACPMFSAWKRWPSCLLGVVSEGWRPSIL